MQHVAFGELVPAGFHDLFAHEVRPRDHQGEYILELVAETVRAAALVCRCAAPQAAGEGLVQKPLVDEKVESGIGRLGLYRAEEIPPHPPRFFECSIDFARHPVLRHQIT